MKRLRTQRGMVSIWFAVTAVVVVGLTGLAVDAGYSVLAMQKLQHAADAAALAAVQQLPLGPEAAQQAAIDIAGANAVAGQAVQLAANPDNLSDGDIVIGFYDQDARTFTPTLTAPNAVKVVARRTNTSLGGRLSLAFGAAFGVPDIGLEKHAIALMANAGGADAGLIVLNESGEDALEVQGSVILDIRSSVVNGTGAIQINSNHPDAVHAQGNAQILADETYIVANPANRPGDKFYEGGWNPGSPLVPDPLADIIPPADWGPVQPTGTFGSNEVVTIEPGHYPDGLTIGAGAEVTMSPGIYVVGGSGLDIDGNGNVYGEGVMLYVDQGPVDIRGTGNLGLTPMDDGDYEGLLLWQARDNTEVGIITGNGDFELEGVLYFPTARVEVEGNGYKFGTRLICDTLYVQGNGVVRIYFGGSGPIGMDRAIFLVE